MKISASSPQVSVIVPVYNGAWSIARCLDALIAEQASVPLEIIVVDDGSTDSTLDILQGYQNQIRVFRQANAGPGAARNTGVAEATAGLVAFMDSDDEIVPGRLRMQLDYMQLHPDVILSFGAIAFRSQPDIPYLSTLAPPQGVWSTLTDPYRHLMTCGGECVNTMTVMLRRDCFLQVGGFDTRYRCGEDTDLWVRLAELGPFSYHGQLMSIVNDICHDVKLTRSSYVYTDGPRALLAILSRDRRLSPPDRAIAVRLVKESAEMMLRYDWTHRGKAQMKSDLALCAPHFGPWFVLKWDFISFLPAGLGRLLRRWRNRSRMSAHPKSAPAS